ncbi:hypothetical protein [Larkinella rosea]|uniref:Uncharacterized protein n=1 Tax=Larkinella rosea TaxID=2025312 RepID=A0A3P1BTH0_9BACT|nr:hypothetical protein [Larkinella rosea]RRB04203.1 hypothetical protein EHT25_11830 [Larkinella rosea]
MQQQRGWLETNGFRPAFRFKNTPIPENRTVFQKRLDLSGRLPRFGEPFSSNDQPAGFYGFS